MRHLNSRNTTYLKHWYRAMSMSIALFIHAFIPSILENYASDKMFEIDIDKELKELDDK